MLNVVLGCHSIRGGTYVGHLEGKNCLGCHDYFTFPNSPGTKVLQAVECRLPGLVYFHWSPGFVIRLLLDLANLLCFLSLHFLCAKIEEGEC